MNATSYPDATEFIIRQQFHRGKDTIIDRMNERRIIIAGVDQVIDSIMNRINSIVSLWETGEKELFLEQVSAFLEIPGDQVIDGVKQKLEALIGTGAGPLVEYMTAMGVAFGLFRETVHNNLIKQIIQTYPTVKPFQEKLEDNLVMSESLLANLAVLYRLSTIAGISIPLEYLHSETAATVERVMGK